MGAPQTLEPFMKNRIGWLHRVAIVLLAGLLSSAGTVGAAERAATFFVGRLKYANNDGNDCAETAEQLAKLVSKVSTIEVHVERKVRTLEDSLFDTPFLFMNGHNDFVFSEQELENLRRYLAHGGFILGSGCCTNPAFPAAWRREFSRLFPGSTVQPIGYDHLIYRSFYKMSALHSMDKSGDIHLEGLFYKKQLVAVMCQDGLCCSFAMDASCNKGKGVPPDEAKKIAVNIAVYALTH
jgi:hypothetical protein